MSFRESREMLLQAEAALLGRFEAEAGAELRLADDAAVLLLAVMRVVKGGEKATVHVGDDGSLSGDVDNLKRLAQLYIAVRALRTMRASRAVLGAGYEPEARAFDRILVELQAHRRAILDDESGAEALAWLNRERLFGISKRVRASGAPDELYASLSTDSHGDPAPVERLKGDDGAIELSPARTVATRTSLLMHAGFARDQAALLASLAGLDVSGLDQLTDAIREGWRGLDEAEVALADPKQ